MSVYTEKDYPSKKAIKEDLAAGKVIRVYDNSMFSTGLVEGKSVVVWPALPETTQVVRTSQDRE